MELIASVMGLESTVDPDVKSALGEERPAEDSKGDIELGLADDPVVAEMATEELPWKGIKLDRWLTALVGATIETADSVATIMVEETFNLAVLLGSGKAKVEFM